MQCGCPECGCYMGQVQRGLDSGCKCPACGYECHDCMGSHQKDPDTMDKADGSTVLSVETLRRMYAPEMDPQDEK